MSEPGQTWDRLSRLFSGEEDVQGIPPAAADNILLAWPPILAWLRELYPAPQGRRALDFGCGAGHFTAKLRELGFDALGMDSSSAMMATARRLFPGLAFQSGDIEALQGRPPFDVVAAIMVLQFIPDLKATAQALDRVLKPGGLLAFAVFNPAFVQRLLEAGMLFKDFDSPTPPRRGIMELVEGVAVPVFIRSEEEYRALFARLGYTCALVARPPFTAEFLRRYPVPFPTDEPEFLILGFQK
ncbi:MAG: class I SAM-dependent methyltransferase [Verrucomicrobia bacterium]|nr:class I SAM-dependent methyltransferase [Verrucomicrobiota bacterium]MBU1909847.1 class I SAM-dependent methyltransferase [Verrucomicrobiota bacterium]